MCSPLTGEQKEKVVTEPARLSTGPSKHVIASCKEFLVRTEKLLLRDSHPRPLESLQPVSEHGPVHLSQDVITHLQDKVRTNPDDVGVKCSVVQLAER